MKIFERKKDGNRRSFYFCGKKFLSYKKGPIEKNNFEIYDEIKKYSYVLDSKFETQHVQNIDYQNCIWQYWGQGVDEAPELVKKCFASVDNCCQHRKIIRLDDSNIDNYIEIPNYMKEKVQAGIMKRAHYADYLRTCLLVKYGGTWIDATVYLTDCIPQEIENSDFFVFKPIAYSECKKVPSMKMLKLLDRIPTYLSSFLCMSNWFIHSKANNRILNLTKSFLEQYWENEQGAFDYFFYHYFVTYAVLNDEKSRLIYEAMPNIANRNPHLMQNVLVDDFDKELFEELKFLSSIHKLTYKQTDNKKSFLWYILSN